MFETILLLICAAMCVTCAALAYYCYQAHRRIDTLRDHFLAVGQAAVESEGYLHERVDDLHERVVKLKND